MGARSDRDRGAPPAAVTVVGCGAAGALLTIALLRENQGRPIRLAVVEPRARPARGVAYSTPDPSHLLNVPACSMSALEGEPADFLHWARRRHGAGEREDFLPRRLFGDYLAETLAAHVEASPPGVSVEFVRDEVRRFEGRAAVLASGRRLASDRFVLALGNGPTRNPARVSSALLASQRYVADPWRGDPRRLARPGESVLLIGTGLTMVDVALSLTGGDAEPPRMLAVSRTGLAARGHRPGQPGGRVRFPPCADTLEELLPAFAATVEAAEREGGDATDVVDALRPRTQEIWSRFDLSERRWFLANLRRQWEVHRHRMAPEVHARMEALRASGTLQIEPAGVDSLRAEDGGVVATLRRGEALEETRFDRVVNCAGPEEDVERFGTAPLASLLEAGLATPDPLALGLAVDRDGALLDSAGHPSDWLHAIGPLRKGSLWETTAIPEIRRQAAELAALLIDSSRSATLAA